MEQKFYVDYSSIGEIESNGHLRLLTGQEAVENALRLWIASFRGEIIRRPELGGYIIQWLMKPLSDDVAIRIREAIEDGLYEDFQPRVMIRRLDIVPNYERDYWKIELEGYCPAIKDNINLSEKLRRIA
jgi:phage baseplate assembly protein W